jgi:outer membrane protein assembly factor BamB
MATHEERQQTPGTGLSRVRRITLALGIILLLGLGGYMLFDQWRRNRIESDRARMAELQSAQLVEPTQQDSLPVDWPQWRGPRRDGISLEKGLSFSWPDSGPKQLWEAPAGEGYSSFAVADGRAYTMLQDGDQEAVVCWNAETGKEQWRYRYPAHFRGQQGSGSGPRSTPSIDGDRIYTVGATGLFHCLHAATGKKLWDHNLLKEFGANNLSWGISFSPLIEGNLVLTIPGGRDGKCIVAFDKISGAVAWQSGDDSASYSSPVAVTTAGRRQVIFFAASGLVGVDPADGKQLWHYPWKNDTDVNAATPIVFSAQAGDGVHDYVFASCNYRPGGCCLVKLTPTADGIVPQRVYETGRMRNHFSSCVRLREQLYGFDDSTLACLDLLTGQIRWRKGGFRKGSLTIAGGHLIILGEYGELAVAEAMTEEYREVAAFQFSDQKCWTVPVVANGRLYLRDEKRVVCYDLRR